MRTLILALGILLLSLSPCMAQKIDNFGVISEEKIVNLPEDGGKWYISVVGVTNDEEYKKVLGWFDSGKLSDLRKQVHFCPVTSDSPLYQERYAPKTVPMVRVQSNTGRIIFEAAGKQLPMSGEALYNAIARAVNGSEELLPWRRNHSNPDVVPAPDKPDQPDGDTDPPPPDLDGDGPPIIDTPDPVLEDSALTIFLVLFFLSVGFGVVRQSKVYHSKKS